MKIGILGGAFNPPTKGHTLLVREVLASGLVDEVWFMPTFNHIDGKKTIPFRDRIKMCRIAIDNMKLAQGVKVSSFEKIFPGEQSTWGIFSKLKETYAHHEFFMIIGMDRALNINEWYNWEELIETIPFIVVDRNHESFITRESLDIDWFRKGNHRYLVNVEIPPVSSTEIRNSISVGSDYGRKLETMIDSQVYEYAQKFYN